MLRSFRIPWAHDPWFGEDKLTHAAWCYAGALTLLFLLPWFLALLFVVVVAVLVEVVQWVRWDIWQNAMRDSEEPRPAFADQPSYRDLAWDAGGIALGIVARLLIAWLVQ